MPADDAVRRRIHLLITGRVQGVGFRYTTVELARASAVSGFVRNLPDGSVELAAEGSAAAVDRFLCLLRESRLSRYIVAQHQREVEPLGESTFAIRS